MPAGDLYLPQGKDLAGNTVVRMSGSPYKASVRVATTTALAANTYSTAIDARGVLTASANGALAAVDGVTLVVGDELLVKDEASGLKNGIYVVTQVGDASNPYKLTRRDDACISQYMPRGTQTAVREGTLNGATQWWLTTTGQIVLGTTALTFSRLTDVMAWATLESYNGLIAAAAPAGTYLLSTDGTAHIISTAAIDAGIGKVHLDPQTGANGYGIAGKTVQLRIVGMIDNWGAAQTGVNYTFGIYPITAISAAGVPTLGAALGQAAAISAPANPSQTAVYGPAITMPAAGHYCGGVVNDQPVAAASTLLPKGLLQIREI